MVGKRRPRKYREKESTSRRCDRFVSLSSIIPCFVGRKVLEWIDE